MYRVRLSVFSTLLLSCFFIACQNQIQTLNKVDIIGRGEVPSLAQDDHHIYLVYGKGDSILYEYSSDKGQSFSQPELVDTVAKLFSFAMRGPQIAATSNGACIIACNQKGNIFSYQKQNGKWVRTATINDVDTVAKEGFLALGGNNKNNLFAIWLDLRNNKHNNLYGARSEDGGKTWLKNEMIYTSPDGHICECCKPSIAVKENTIAVMFRNWINGNRDLYLTQSSDGGQSFLPAKKLGNKTWKLDGCPMDGGGLTLNKESVAQTVWQRQGKIFACEPGNIEKEIGEGKSCTLTIVNGNIVYAWVEKGEIIIENAKGEKINLGKGNLPVIKTVNEDQIICVWQNEQQILRKIIKV